MATWTLFDETCSINFKRSGTTFRTIPKELCVLQIVPAGQPLNDTTVDNVFVRYEGKYVIELPYNDTTVDGTSYASAELLRAALLALQNSNPCAGSGGDGITLDPASPESITMVWAGSQAEYDGLTPDASTLYFIVP